MEGNVQSRNIGKSKRECINVADEEIIDIKKFIKSIEKE